MAAGIGSEPVHMTIRQFLAGGATLGLAFLAGLWAVGSFLLGGVQQDIRELRAGADGLRAGADKIVEKGAITETDLRQAIFNIEKSSAITAETVSGLLVQFTTVANNVSSLNDTMIKFQEQIGSLDGRLAGIETQIKLIPTTADWHSGKLNFPTPQPQQ